MKKRHKAGRTPFRIPAEQLLKQDLRGQNNEKSVCKPGSVIDSHSSRTCVTTSLKQPTRLQCGSHHRRPIWSCSERGLPCHKLLPVVRCALTAPFHPYLCIFPEENSHRRFALCCTFRRLSPPRRYLAFYPMEPGLSSPRKHKARRQRLSDQLQRARLAPALGNCKPKAPPISNPG